LASALYICYQSVREPLTSTQVVAYLEGLARAGYRIVLLTFEPRALSDEETAERRTRLEHLGITWTWVRYHKWPSVPATAWDILVGVVVGWMLIRKHKIRLIHARVHVPGLMGWILKKLTRAKLLFDLRGFMAEEYVDAGVWPADGFLFRATKWVERRLVRDADGIVVLTRRAKDLLAQWYPDDTRNKPIQVIPCCVDLRNYRRQANGDAHGSASPKTIVYIGKLGGWYLTDSMVAFMARAMKQIPDLRWDIWTQSDPAQLRQALSERGINDRVTVGTAPSEEIPERLRRASAGLSLIKPCISKVASSPTKVGEYLAAGLPVISTSGIGDMDEWLDAEKPVGMLIRDFRVETLDAAVPRLLQVLEDPEMSERCRRTAEEHLDLERVGWARYRETYETVAGSAHG
jgi:glycosyltransferase involved in cell wall biosynthesis